MKIVINTDQIYLHGGIEKVTATKVNYWANQPDTEVFIVTTEQQGNPPCYPLDDRVHLIDLEVNYNRNKSYFSSENLIKGIKHFNKQRKLFKELKADVIISPNFNFDFYWLPFIARKSKKIKEFHSSRYNWIPSLRNRINAWFEKNYDVVVVLNKDEATHYPSDNVVVIPNPIEKTDFQASLNNKQVIAAGRISPVKRFDDLIRAWALVNRQFPDWQLHIYGQDYSSTQAKLEHLVAELDLKEVVFFNGSVDNIPETMTDYSMYAMTSETECFPMVLLEALAVGLPVVSYDCPYGPGNIITDRKDGLLSKYKDIYEFADKVAALINNIELRKEMGNKAKENSVRFVTDSVMSEWSALFKNLTNKKQNV